MAMLFWSKSMSSFSQFFSQCFANWPGKRKTIGLATASLRRVFSRVTLMRTSHRSLAITRPSRELRLSRIISTALTLKIALAL
jgi:hypothetical protein